MPIGPLGIAISNRTTRFTSAAPVALIASGGTTTKNMVLCFLADNSGTNSQNRVISSGGPRHFFNIRSNAACFIDYDGPTNGIGIPTPSLNTVIQEFPVGAAVSCHTVAVARRYQES